MENIQNTLLLDNDKITEMGVSVFEVSDLPARKIPIVSPHYIISVCHSGSIDVEYESSSFQYFPHDMAIVYPNHALIAHRVSPDYRATLVVVSADIYARMGRINFSDTRFSYEVQPHFHLTESQYEDVLSFIDAIRRTASLNMKNRIEILMTSIDILSQAVDFFRNTSSITATVPNKSLSYRFYNAVFENCHQQRNVQFYAQFFHLTPKYFSKVIQLQTGHTAGYWIQHFVVLRSKHILTYEPDISIQSIADRFNFPDQASFCRYFKRVTGMSPSQYRAGK